ncbi:MAG TPA: flagellar motor stator protein MotA [Deltaproteobacteria bacterium]|nr:flagellar motor stator protein MotA [Deltaproteobacteria bacterium]
MNVIIGIVIVLGCVFGGFVLEKGNLHSLFQPIELLIILGAAIGGMIISSPFKLLKEIAAAFKGMFAPTTYDSKKFIEVLSLLYEIFNKMRKEGIIAIESHVEEPTKSEIFKKYPNILKNHGVLNFICDSLKILLSIDIPPHEFDNLLEVDIEAAMAEKKHPLHRVEKMADSLPGLGIVAAVLGVVLTMGKMSEPPEVLGHSVGAALVGTFLGVLLCYGIVGPMGVLIDHHLKEEESYYHVIRIAMVSYVARSIPQIAIEFARRAIPESERPGFSEMEKIMKGKGK